MYAECTIHSWALHLCLADSLLFRVAEACDLLAIHNGFAALILGTHQSTGAMAYRRHHLA